MQSASSSTPATSGSQPSGTATGSTPASGTNTTASTSGSTTSGSSGGGCATLPLCDGFESDTAGSAPSAALWQIIGAGGCSGQGSGFSVTVDSSQANSGSKSLKVVGGDSCGPLMVNTSAVAGLGGEVYGRFFTRFSTARTWGHTVFAALSFLADAGPLGNNAAEYLQMAALADGTTPIMEWNFSDTELPQRNGMEVANNVYPAANAWTCIEFHTSKSQGSVEVWVNGTADSNMTFIPGTTAVTSINMPWSTKHPALDVRGVGFGWVDFDGQGPNTLWFDDVALAGTRIGCQL
jgi:hypothetical protein